MCRSPPLCDMLWGIFQFLIPQQRIQLIEVQFYAVEIEETALASLVINPHFVNSVVPLTKGAPNSS
jgi:hypothetical protein